MNRRLVPFAAPILIALLTPAAATAVAGPLDSVAGLDAAIAEASTAYGLSGELIWRVIRAESAGDPRAVSSKGAMGLMQLMPATWRELRRRLRLGVDPFDPHDNILAGAAYLRQMLDEFGPGGFLAAYNLGAANYGNVLAGRAALPRKTRDYIAAIAPERGGVSANPPPPSRSPMAPSASGLFPFQPPPAP